METTQITTVLFISKSNLFFRIKTLCVFKYNPDDTIILDIINMNPNQMSKNITITKEIYIIRNQIYKFKVRHILIKKERVEIKLRGKYKF